MVVDLEPYKSVFVAVSIMALQSSRLSYTGLPFSTVTDVIAENGNARSPIEVTLWGITTDVSLVDRKAHFPILIKLFGRVTSVSLVPENADFPIEVKSSGRLIDIN